MAALKVHRPYDVEGTSTPIAVDPIQNYARMPEQALRDDRLTSRDTDVLFSWIAAMRADGSPSETFATISDITTDYSRLGITAVKRGTKALQDAGYLCRERDYSKPCAPFKTSLSFAFATRRSPPPEPFVDRPSTQPELPLEATMTTSEMCMQWAQNAPSKGAKCTMHPY